MVKAVVFDMGNILLDFHTHELAAAFAENEADAQELYRAFWLTAHWPVLDRGGTEAQVLEAVRGELPHRLWDSAGQIMEHWDEYLIPRPEINDLARELDRLGMPLYILSNTSGRFYRFREKIPVWPLIRGALLSCEEHLLKPDLEIYRRLFARFGLAPGECFFIDDLASNVEGAWCVGMHGAVFDGDLPRLRRALNTAGVPVSRTAGPF